MRSARRGEGVSAKLTKVDIGLGSLTKLISNMWGKKAK